MIICLPTAAVGTANDNLNNTSQHMSAETPLERIVRRNSPDNIKVLLDRSTSLARISTGISLQTTLLNDHVSIEPVVKELLNIGDSKLTDFKSDTMKGFTGKMNEIKKKSNKNDDVEKMIMKFDKIRMDSESVTTLDDLKEVDEYFNKIISLSNFDLAAIDLSIEKLNELSAKLDVVDKASKKATNQMTNQNNWDKIKEVFGSIESYKKFLPFVRDLSTNFENFMSLQSYSVSLKPYNTLMKLMQTRSDMKSPSTDPLKQEITDLLTLVSLASSSKSSFAQVFQVMHYRSNPTLSTRAYTTGLSNGLSDFNKLLTDIRDPWFEKSIVKDAETQQLVDGLKPLLLLQPKLTELDKKLNLFSSNSRISSIDIQLLQEELQTAPIDKKEADDILQILEASSTTKVAPAAYQSIQAELVKAENLAKMVETVKQWSDHFMGKELSDAFDAFDKELVFTDRTNEAQSQNEIPKVMSNLVSKNAIATFKAALAKANNLLSTYTADAIKKAAADINQKVFNDFKAQKEVVNELNLYKNLRENEKQLGNLVESIHVIKRVRSIDSNQIDLVDSLAIALSGITTELSAVKLKPIVDEMKKEKLKNTETKGIEAVMNSKDAATMNKNIGDAVTGLQKIQNFRRSNLDDMDQLVKKSVSKVSDSKKKTEIEGDWSDLKEVIALRQSIDQINNKMSTSGVKDIAGYGSLFVGFEKIGDVDLSKKMKAIDELIRNVQDPTLQISLKEAKGALEALDLKFSSHKSSFNAAPTSFKSLQDFFHKLFVAKKTVPTVSSGDTSTPSDGSIILGMGVIGLSLSVGSVVLLIILLSCVFCPCCPIAKYIKRKKQKKNDVEAQPLVSDAPSKPSKVKSPEKSKDPVIVKSKKEIVLKSTKEIKKEVEEKKKEEKEKKKEEKEKKKSEKIIAKKVETLEKSKKKIGEYQEKEKEKTPMKTAKEGIEEKFLPYLKWVSAQYLSDRDDAIVFHYEAMQVLCAQFKDAKPNPKKYLDVKKFRSPGNPLNDVEHTVDGLMRNGKEVRINANQIRSRSGFQWLPTQGPMTKEENFQDKQKVNEWKANNPGNREIPNFPRDYDDTTEDFWLMAMTKGCEKIVMLCKFVEGGISKCGRYFSDSVEIDKNVVTCGCYTITTVKIEDFFKEEDGPDWKRSFLEVVDNNTYEKRTFTHYYVRDWKDGSIPLYGPEQLWLLMDEVKQTEKPVIVHCSSGIGRTMVFIGMDFGYEEVMFNPSLHMTDILEKLRRYRWKGIQTVRQSFYLQVGIVYKVVKHCGFNKSHYKKREQLLLSMHATDVREGEMYKKLFYKDANPIEIKGRVNFPF